MKSLKRSIALTVGLAAVTALVIAGSASAAVIFTAKGVPAHGSILTAETTSPLGLGTGIGSVVCSSWRMQAELIENRKESSEGHALGVFKSVGVGEGLAQECSNSKVSVEIRHISLVELSSDELESGTAWMSFEMILGGWACQYEGSEIPFTIKLGTDRIQFTNAKVKARSGACFGDTTLSAGFTVSANGWPAEFRF